jgi:hypothetical protein
VHDVWIHADPLKQGHEVSLNALLKDCLACHATRDVSRAALAA